MRLLLDTHVAVWSLAYPERLSALGRNLISDHRNAIFVSAVSVWEIAIKRALGRTSAPPMPTTEAISRFDDAGFAMLDVTVAHAAAVEALPLLHGDPFDRLLIAQALVEPLKMLTSDRQVVRYSETFFLV